MGFDSFARRVAVLICVVGGLAMGSAQAASVPAAVRRAAIEGRAVWVFFNDKGPSSETNQYANRPWVSDRAMARITRRGAPYHIQDDWPVYAGYKDELTGAGLSVRSESKWLNAVAVVVPPEKLQAVADMQSVRSLRPVALYTRALPSLDEEAPPRHKPSGSMGNTAFDYGPSEAQITAIQADRLHRVGLDGSGVLVGFMDTGFDASRAVFDSLRLVATRDFINGDIDVGDGDLSQMSHGTATLSVCGGYLPGELIGVAPRADYALAKTEVVNVETQIEEDYWLAGIEWLDSLGCDLASSSLGYTDWYTYADMDGNTAVTTIAADMAAARGLLVINSAGNEGNKAWHYIIAPSDGDSVLAVGATTVEGVRVPFSSVGPTSDGRIKPDVMAPGLDVWSAIPGSDSFSGKAGTSFSAPLVTGVCALLLQNDPDLTPYKLITSLRQTATNNEHPDPLMGWGIVQAAAASGLYVENDHGSGVELWPNPMDDLVRIVLPASDPDGTSRVWIYTVSGQLVHKETFQGHSTLWQGRNDDGGLVASGVYLVLVRTPVREELVKLAVLRP